MIGMMACSKPSPSLKGGNASWLKKKIELPNRKRLRQPSSKIKFSTDKALMMRKRIYTDKGTDFMGCIGS
mgnify:CR=1 FL=1